MSKTTTKEWFAVDREGLSKLLEERGAAFAVLELIQNALDTSATTISIDIDRVEGRRGAYHLKVVDDDPNGFTNLAHAFTLFAESEKKGVVNLRGRFNLGEKLVLALCETATIASTRGAVTFDAKGRHENSAGATRVGSIIDMVIRLTADDVAEVKKLVRTVLIPEGVKVTFNSILLPERPPIREIKATLPTVITSANGALKNSARKTTIRLVALQEGEKAHLYELGIPVVRIDLPFHVDVQQKVPVGFDRNAVSPSYAKTISVAVVNEAADLVANEENAAKGWVGDALGSKDISPEGVRAILEAKFPEPERVLLQDISDPESRAEAESMGYTVIGGRTFDKDQWDSIRTHAPDLFPRAGLVTPSRNSIMRNTEADIQLKPEQLLAPERLTDRQKVTVEYVRQQASWLLGRPVMVRVVESDLGYLASWGSAIFTLNSKRLYPAWWSNEEAVDRIIIHEVAHSRAGDHLDHKFYEAVIEFGAKLRNSTIRLS